MKHYKPTTPSRRHMSVVSYRNVLTRSEPQKSLTRGFKRGVGRNSAGRITVRHKGGGVKRSYREIDFKYDKIDIPATVSSVEYDPNRSGFISLFILRRRGQAICSFARRVESRGQGAHFRKGRN